MQYFQTSDMALASYLKANNIDLREITRDSEHEPCIFVFRVSPEDEGLQRLIFNWDNTAECSNMKRLLWSQKLIKKALKEFFINNQWYGDEKS